MPLKRRVGILLTGCGAYDGSDPHESVLAMLAFQEAGIEVVPLVHDALQFHVVDPTTGQEVDGESRRMMLESARLVRGKLWTIEELSPKLLDGLILPGGQGPVKSLMQNFNPKEEPGVLPAIKEFLEGCHKAGAVLAAISLSEFLLTALFGPWPGDRGCFDLGPEDVLVDRDNWRLLTPGYTLATSLPQLNRGIRNLRDAMIQLMDEDVES